MSVDTVETVTPSAEGTARCGGCKQTKPVNDFCRDRSRVTGRASHCRECMRVRARRKYDARPRSGAPMIAGNSKDSSRMSDELVRFVNDKCVRCSGAIIPLKALQDSFLDGLLHGEARSWTHRRVMLELATTFAIGSVYSVHSATLHVIGLTITGWDWVSQDGVLTYRKLQPEQ